MVSIEGFEPSPHAPKAWTLPGYAIRRFNWYPMQDLNLRPTAYQAAALPLS
jgi:hypothetical protein